MHVQRNRTFHKGKEYKSVLLRQCYYENGKTKQKTISNISHLPEYLIRTIEYAIKKKKENYFKVEDLEFKDSYEYGDVFVLNELINELGLDKMIYSKNIEVRKLIIAMLILRILSPSSKLENVKLIEENRALKELLKLNMDNLRVDDLYKALDYLRDRQDSIEKKLYKRSKDKLHLFLYDITSVYFEGQEAELSAYGYNRDKKKGKKQVVIGLVCDKEGYPISIEVFPGNTKDSSTVKGKIEKLKERYDIEKGIIVGDRGMILESNLKDIEKDGFQYITAVTHRRLKSLIDDVHTPFQMGLFDETSLVEIEYEGKRYILNKNPKKKKEDLETFELLLENTKNKLEEIKTSVKNKKLKKVEKIGLRVGKWINKWKVGSYFETEIKEGYFDYKLIKDKVEMNKNICGCYVITTNVDKETLNTEEVVGKYKDLILVERAFRTIKTTLLRIRPIYHWKEERIKAHAFLCMLSYYIVVEMKRRLSPLFKENGKGRNYELTYNDVLRLLSQIKVGEIEVSDLTIYQIKKLTKKQEKIMKSLKIELKLKNSIKH